MSNSTTDSARPMPPGGKYLTFILDREEYGLTVHSVREIVGYMESTALPHMPKHVCGVINLRGQVISVIDLRARFEMPPLPRTDRTCIIIVELKTTARPLHMGVVVDRVSEVLQIPQASIEEPPSFGNGLSTSLILGMAKVNGGVKILLDIDKCLTTNDAIRIAPESAAA